MLYLMLTFAFRYEIAVAELIRLYQFWLGLPVNPRTWKFQVPQLDADEL
jgi:hypothetical protein